MKPQSKLMFHRHRLSFHTLRRSLHLFHLQLRASNWPSDLSHYISRPLRVRRHFTQDLHRQDWRRYHIATMSHLRTLEHQPGSDDRFWNWWRNFNPFNLFPIDIGSNLPATSVLLLFANVLLESACPTVYFMSTWYWNQNYLLGDFPPLQLLKSQTSSKVLRCPKAR